MKMVNKMLGKESALTLSLLVLILSILSINSVTALNAAVGNGKFVISNATVGDVIQRTMKVYNNNTFEVRIELIPTGNLTKYIKIIDNNITMAPLSEKEFRFSVKVPQEGRNDGEIDVKFTPANMTANGKNGIIIPTTMIIFAKKGNGVIDWTGWFGSGDKNNTNTNKTGTDPGNDGSGMGMFEILFMVTAIIFIILLISLYIYSRRKNQGVKGEKLNTKKRNN